MEGIREEVGGNTETKPLKTGGKRGRSASQLCGDSFSPCLSFEFLWWSKKIREGDRKEKRKKKKSKRKRN